MCNFLEQQLIELVKSIESRHPDDPDVTEWLHQMAALVLESEEGTVSFFHHCDSRHSRIIYWLSPFLEDMANEFSSDELINAMNSLPSKYPDDKGLVEDVRNAIRIIHSLNELSDDLSR